MEAIRGVVLGSCNLHVPIVAKDKEGPTPSVLHVEHEEASDEAYGPWVMVTRKKTRSARAKRKHSPLGMINGAQLGSVLQGLRKVSNHQAHNALKGGPTFTRLENSGNHKGKEGVSPKGLSKASVKGKKDFARLGYIKLGLQASVKDQSACLSLCRVKGQICPALMVTNGREMFQTFSSMLSLGQGWVIGLDMLRTKSQMIPMWVLGWINLKLKKDWKWMMLLTVVNA